MSRSTIWLVLAFVATMVSVLAVSTGNGVGALIALGISIGSSLRAGALDYRERSATISRAPTRRERRIRHINPPPWHW